MAVALVLFVAVFLAVFWTPGVLLGVFVLVAVADSRTLSQAHDFRQRVRRNRHAAAVYRGGRLESLARRD